VAAGEYSWSLADSARLIEAGAVDCLQLDVTRCGGVTEFLRGAALAAGHNLPLFDGVLDPRGGKLAPDPGRPGLGLELRAADAARYRSAGG